MSDFKLPELGENITAGDVVRVLVKAGDTIAKEQAVIELETDKATIEVPSSIAGVVKDVQVKPGEKVKVGQVIFTTDEGKATQDAKESKEQPKAEAKPEAKAEPKKEGGDKPKAQPEGAPEEGGMSQAATADRGDESGGAAEAKEDREGDKDGVAEPPRSQRPPARLAEDDVEETPRQQKRGEVVDISRAPRAAQGAPAQEEPAPPAAPSVRRIARELGVDIRQVTGNGPGGRITVDDVQGFVRQALASGSGGSGAPSPAGAPSSQPLPDFSKWGEIERKPVSNIRRKTAEHLGHAWNVIPHVTQYDKADITTLEELRKKYSPMAERAGGKLTVTAIALKILAGAVRKFPQFASSLDAPRGQLIYKKFSHIGVAVDTDRGLLVAVIRDVASKGIIDLSVELAKVSEKARAGKLTLDEMSGGVMTISNLGGIGGHGFTPIVNWPEVAILGISRGTHEPVWDGAQFQPRMMLPLSLSYDHRVIDGADAARFLRWVADAFEQPFVLAL
jgi:pyruvate dehydrogenase E2 component (dihydrolipoamide acetyltransferase)